MSCHHKLHNILKWSGKFVSLFYFIYNKPKLQNNIINITSYSSFERIMIYILQFDPSHFTQSCFGCVCVCVGKRYSMSLCIMMYKIQYTLVTAGYRNIMYMLPNEGRTKDEKDSMIVAWYFKLKCYMKLGQWLYK